MFKRVDFLTEILVLTYQRYRHAKVQGKWRKSLSSCHLLGPRNVLCRWRRATWGQCHLMYRLYRECRSLWNECYVWQVQYHPHTWKYKHSSSEYRKCLQSNHSSWSTRNRKTAAVSLYQRWTKSVLHEWRISQTSNCTFRSPDQCLPCEFRQPRACTCAAAVQQSSLQRGGGMNVPRSWTQNSRTCSPTITVYTMHVQSKLLTLFLVEFHLLKVPFMDNCCI